MVIAIKLHGTKAASSRRRGLRSYRAVSTARKKMSLRYQPERFAMASKTRKAICLGALFGFVACSTLSLGVPLFDLGTAGPTYWTVLEAGDGTVIQTVDASNPQGAIYGNVGITLNGHFQDSGPTVYGDLYLGDQAHAQFSGTYVNNRPVTGTIHLGTGATVTPNSYSYTKVSDNPQPLLTQARADAIAGSAAAAALTPTSTLQSISLSHTTMTLGPGVYNLKNFLLDHSTLTLSGSGYFVFNISNPNSVLTANGTFKLNSGKVLLAGGATADHVLFNYLGTKDVAFSGGTGGTVPGGPDESVLHGIILAMNAKVSLAPGLVVGEIISGKNISIVSGAIVEQPPPQVPDASSTLALGCIAIAALLAFRSLAPRSLVR